MSRIGKRPIEIPQGVEVTQEGATITVKGPKGTLVRNTRPEVAIKIDGNAISLEPTNNSKFATSLWGTYGSHLHNMISGVVTPFEKKLIIEGVGFRVEMTGNKLVFSLGFSHKVEMEVPEGLTVTVEKNVVTISGIDKEKVGQFASQIRSKKKPEPYKGKGIRYADEIIKRKEGKKSA
jgi:large subunit ribosomal protein L6